MGPEAGAAGRPRGARARLPCLGGGRDIPHKAVVAGDRRVIIGRAVKPSAAGQAAGLSLDALDLALGASEARSVSTSPVTARGTGSRRPGPCPVQVASAVPPLTVPRPPGGALLPARPAAEGGEVQADEDDRRGAPAPGQVQPPGDPADGAGTPAGSRRRHHQDHQVGAPEAGRLESQGQGWSARRGPAGGRELPRVPVRPLQRAQDPHPKAFAGGLCATPHQLRPRAVGSFLTCPCPFPLELLEAPGQWPTLAGCGISLTSFIKTAVPGPHLHRPPRLQIQMVWGRAHPRAGKKLPHWAPRYTSTRPSLGGGGPRERTPSLNALSSPTFTPGSEKPSF